MTNINQSIVYYFLLLLFFISIAQAREPLPPRLSASAYTGVYTVGQADLMLSLDGDQRHNLYVNPQGAYGTDQQWYGDLGLGYRWIKNDAAILGWYLFAGHSRVENNSGFWITNPGVEVMGSRWDARINAYIPVAGRSNELGLEEFNIVSTPFFTGHSEFINSVFNDENAIQQIGNGADARVGYQLFRYVPLKGYLGAYFFDIANTDNVRGGAAGLEYWFDDNIRVFANYSYDNYQHSKVIGGLGISFGGVRKHHADPSLSERLMDPVDRYLANLGHGSGIPSKTLLYGMGRGSSSVLVSDSIAFFSQSGTPNNGGTGLTLANCTFENPCGPTDFSQTGVNNLNTLIPNTNFYFNGGSYPANNGGSPLSLNNGQSVFSRTADYSAPATGAARSTFNGGFNLIGNNTLDGVILNNTLSTVAIFAQNAPNLVLSNSQLGSASIPYAAGIVLLSDSDLTIQNTSINTLLQGISVQDSALTMEGSVLNTGGLGFDSQGITFIDTSTGDILDSQINVFGTAGSSSVTAITARDISTVSIENTDITVNYQTTPPSGSSRGLSTTNSAEIQMLNGSLSVAGNTSSVLTSGSNIVLELVSCNLNGVVGC